MALGALRALEGLGNIACNVVVTTGIKILLDLLHPSCPSTTLMLHSASSHVMNITGVKRI